VGTTVEVEDLDQRAPHPVILPCENCSPEQQHTHRRDPYDRRAASAAVRAL
jgi:hypothetical protein